MIGPLTVQSILTLLLGSLVIAGSMAPTAPWRRAYLLLSCLMLSISWLTRELPTAASSEIHFWMGDYGTYTEDRSHFDAYFSLSQSVRFHFHLSRPILYLLDRALGSDEASPQRALLFLSWLFGVVFIVGLILIAKLDHWSSRVTRYAGLAIASPAALFYFGYRELGYLPLSVVAFPLLLRGLSAEGPRRTAILASCGIAHGLRSALHGFGLVGLAGALVAVLVRPGALWSRMADAATLGATGLASYLVWIPLYLIILGQNIVPGHATNIPIRRLTESFVAESRTVFPIFSQRGLSDLFYESVVVCLPVAFVGVALARRQSCETRTALGYLSVSVLALTFIWPAQGIALDIDSVFGLFPAVFVGLWFCARSRRASLVALAFILLAHGVFWLLVRNREFTNPIQLGDLPPAVEIQRRLS
jgi:hypothetical protein